MATVEEQYAQRQAETQKTYDTRQAQDQATYDQRQAQAQATYDQRNAEARNTYNQRLNESQGKITDLYGKAFEAQKLQLQNALDKGVAAQEEARANIAKTYQTASNDLAVQYERNRRNLNAQAMARGLNTGTASQQQLALNQGFMGAYGKLRGEEGSQNAGIDRAIANLKVDYQNGVAQALANNDYQKAAALMDDYNNKLNWLDNQTLNNRNFFDTQSQNNQSRLDSMVLNNRNYFDTGSANNRNWADAETRYQDQQNQQKAQILASYGDFSGFAALYGQDTANNMREMWIVQNPLDAYNVGAINADRYRSITGQDPPGASSGSGGGGYSGYYGGSAENPDLLTDPKKALQAVKDGNGNIITAGDVGWGDTKAQLGLTDTRYTSQAKQNMAARSSTGTTSGTIKTWR